MERDDGYELRFHKKFEKCYREIKDPVTRSAIQKKLQKFKDDPHHFSAPLMGMLAGDREIKVLKDLRIIVTICRECRDTGHQMKHKCPCSQMQDNYVIVWWVGNHDGLKKSQDATTIDWQ